MRRAVPSFSPIVGPRFWPRRSAAFVRAGFHGASMQDICAEAGMSPGNLYRYFPSKEALIAGIAERDRAEIGQQFARADLSRGLFPVLEGLAHHFFAERPREQVLLCTEVMAEARRHPDIARISASFDVDVRKWLGRSAARRCRTRRYSRRHRFRRRHHHADGHRRRGVVAPRA
jgi:AcrR family transcriptional regulator